MTTYWQASWELRWFVMTLSLDLQHFVIGVSWSNNDICLMLLPCVTISFDWWKQVG